MDIEIKYDGKYPNLCSGCLYVIIDGYEWSFPRYCLVSGGGVSFDDDWHENIWVGPWSISEWPKDFPEELKRAVEDKINATIDHGCCGGCV